MNLQIGDWIVTTAGAVASLDEWRKDYEVWVVTIVFSRNNLLKHGERVSLLPGMISHKLDRSPYPPFSKACPCPPAVVVTKVDWTKDNYWHWEYQTRKYKRWAKFYLENGDTRLYDECHDVFQMAEKEMANYEGLMP